VFEREDSGVELREEKAAESHRSHSPVIKVKGSA
jgi:hypothetical protein